MSHKNHGFQSFSARVAKIHVNPLRKRRHDLQTAHELQESKPSFSTTLDYWSERNLSTSFRSFSAEARPLCRSLAQVLHHSESLFRLLAQYISRKDLLSLEAFLDLLRHLAIDLAHKFEPFLLETVSIIASLVSRHARVEILEWSFVCLSWLFKYMSRLLLPHTESIFVRMTPLLGKEPQTVYVIQFAAEALAFLVKRAAAFRDGASKLVERLVSTLRQDLQDAASSPHDVDTMARYKGGIKLLLTNTLKNNSHGLHRHGLSVYYSLFDSVTDSLPQVSHDIKDILSDVTVTLGRSTDPEELKSIVLQVLDRGRRDCVLSDCIKMETLAKLCSALCTLPETPRTFSWIDMIGLSLELLENKALHSGTEVFCEVKMLAEVLERSPWPAALQASQRAVEILIQSNKEQSLLGLCIYFHEICQERFDDLFLPHFLRFLYARSDEKQLELLTCVPKLLDINHKDKPNCPESWLRKCQELLLNLSRTEDSVAECFGLLQAMQYLSIDDAPWIRISRIMESLVEDCLHDSSHKSRRLILGNMLLRLAQGSSSFRERSPALWPLLCRNVEANRNLIPFLESLNLLLEDRNFGCTGSDACTMISSVVKNLHSPSSKLRKISLHLLKTLHSQSELREKECLDTMMLIEDSDISLRSARLIPMQARRLGPLYLSISDVSIKQAIVHFSFGMLTYKIGQARDEAVTQLKSISGVAEGEVAVSDLILSWLNGPQSRIEDASIAGLDNNIQHCTSFTKTLSHRSNEVEDGMVHSFTITPASAASELRNVCDGVTQYDPFNNREAPSLALLVLSKNPALAEKYSGHITPHLLSWVDEDRTDTIDMHVAENHTSPSGPSQHLRQWSMKDRKALLSIFTNFKKPWKIAQSEEVLCAHKALLTHGDVDVQRFALEAILKWKQAEIVIYHEHLLNVLDNTKMRDTITAFWSVDGEQTLVQTAHRPFLMPLLLRLLYGRMISKATYGKGKGEQEARRKTIIRSLANLDDAEITDFVSIALQDLNNIRLLDTDFSIGKDDIRPSICLRRLSGSLNVLKVLLQALGSRLQICASHIIEAVLYCFIDVPRSSPRNELDVDTETSLSKPVRQNAFKCLRLVAEKLPPSVLKPYMSMIYSKILNSRLANLSVETAQAVSSTLRLFATWTRSVETLPFLINPEIDTLVSISHCLRERSSREEVILYVIEDIFTPLFVNLAAAAALAGENAIEHKDLVARLLSAAAEPFFSSLNYVLERTSNKAMLRSGIQLVGSAATVIGHTPQAHALVRTSVTLLNQPAVKIDYQAKTGLLTILTKFLPTTKTSLPVETVGLLYTTLSRLFGYFKDREGRVLLLEAFRSFAIDDVELQSIVFICQGLNAFSSQKVDEPDYEERYKAFGSINDSSPEAFSARQWRPLLYNLLFFIKDQDELAMRNYAASCLQKFIDHSPRVEANSISEMQRLSQDILLPSARKGACEVSEIVRAEYLALMAHMTGHDPTWDEISDLVPLLANGDDEASFFSNVLHIQQHRRLRAIRRLNERARTEGFQSVNVAHYLIPLLEHFVFSEHQDEAAHNLSAECVTTIGALTLSLEWVQFRAMFKKYSAFIKSKPDHLKRVIRMLGVMADSLKEAVSTETASPTAPTPRIESALSRSRPKNGKFDTEVSCVLVPPLVAYVHEKEESTVSLRVPVSISAVKLLTLLPDSTIEQQLPPILTDICNILRSRAQESRDATRKTLAQISLLLGPRYLSFIVQELRTALSRGSHLHVLSFTLHSVLSETSVCYTVGDLGDALPQIVAVVMEDIFGKTGHEKEAEEYTSKMREVKSCKSYDTMELLARKVTIDSLVDLITPLQTVLEQNLDLRTFRKSQELLRRVHVGLLQNEAMADQRFLVLCHEMIRMVYKRPSFKSKTAVKSPLTNSMPQDQSHHDLKGNTSEAISPYRRAVTQFVFDVLRAILQKHEGLMTPSNLHGFLPVIGDAIVHVDEDIKVSVLRLLSLVIRVPWKVFDENAAVYIAECVHLVKNSPSTDTESSQAAYKLVSVILSHKHSVAVRESDLAFLLKRLTADLDNPEKQFMAFNFLKAMLTRRIVIPEVYETMDKVASIMVTNHTRNIRDLARGAYLKFVIDYPQDRARFSKQLGFLIRNLDYKYHEGRQSVMEALHLLLTKTGEEILQEIIGKCWVPLVMRVANEDTSQCREMASALLQSSFAHAGTPLRESMLRTLRIWLDQSEEPLLQLAALQTYGIYLGSAMPETTKVIENLLPRLLEVLQEHLTVLGSTNGELICFILDDFALICRSSPSQAFDAACGPMWKNIRTCLTFPNLGVQKAAIRLMSTFYNSFARPDTDPNTTSLPLIGSQGLKLTGEEICADVEIYLNSIETAAGRGVDIVVPSTRNLGFLLEVMSQDGVRWPVSMSSPKPRTQLERHSTIDGEGGICVPEEAPRLATDHILHRLSYILRQPSVSDRPESLLPLKSALQLLTLLLKHTNASDLRSRLIKFLKPLNHLTDTSVTGPLGTDSTFKETYEGILATARELMTRVQEKVGMKDFVAVLHQEKERANLRRKGRREKRAIEKVIHPERAGRQKRIKFEKKKKQRKQKSADYRTMRKSR